MFSIGLGIFTARLRRCRARAVDRACSTSRAPCRASARAIVMPLTLTILSAGVPAERRGVFLGAWGGISGLAVAFGPLVGGAVVERHLLALDLLAERPDRARARCRSRCCGSTSRRARSAASTCPASRSSASGLFGIVWALVRGNSVGWGSPEIVGAFVVGVAVRRRVRRAGSCAPSTPMLPMRFFRNRTFALANVASLLMSFGMFGSIFLLAQFFQTVQGYSPLGSGLRILPWTAMPMIVAPIAGALSDRISPSRIIGTGLALQAIGLAWIAAVSTPTTPLRRPRRAVRDLRDRHGDVLRADRERRPLDGARRGRGPGLGREQRDPRARRRLRRRGARRGVRALRRLLERHDVRRTG